MIMKADTPSNCLHWQSLDMHYLILKVFKTQIYLFLEIHSVVKLLSAN